MNGHIISFGIGMCLITLAFCWRLASLTTRAYQARDIRIAGRDARRLNAMRAGGRAPRPKELHVFPLGEGLGFHYWLNGYLHHESFSRQEERELVDWYRALGRPKLAVSEEFVKVEKVLGKLSLLNKVSKSREELN